LNIDASLSSHQAHIIVIQEALEQDNPGATIVPIIISTDKTLLTQFRNKNAYPVYLTIGNIPKEIRCKPSCRAYVLLGYLPTTRLENEANKASRRRQLANLYHACMSKILHPLKHTGESSIFMTTGDGVTHRNHPLLACFAGDYPEQVLTTATFTGECPVCPMPHDHLGEYDCDNPAALQELEHVLEVLDSFDEDPAGFLQACKVSGVKPIVEPFWKDLPYAHIYRSITPDILHQLYQGVVKHIIGWIIKACGAAEIDARCRRMLPNHNIHNFMKGISTLSHVTGQEHDQMSHILLGLVIDIPLPGGLSNVWLIRAVRALLDFLYLAQYPVHTNETLELLEDALAHFHDVKDIFVDLGIRDSFNIPKLHFVQHYMMFIRLYGTTDNFDTAYTERLHIDFAKDAYAVTNHKDEFTQMAKWLERKEKMFRHEQYVKWQEFGSSISGPRLEWEPPGLELGHCLHMTKHPTVRAVPVNRLVEVYGATYFHLALARFIALANDPNLSHTQLEAKLCSIRIPFRAVPVWHRIKYLHEDPISKTTVTSDSIHVQPSTTDSHGCMVPGHFDTVLVNEGMGGDTGIEGKSSRLCLS
jgi:Plavaka transposase